MTVACRANARPSARLLTTRPNPLVTPAQYQGRLLTFPVDGRYIFLGPATREVWTHGRLATDYPDLLAWRDRLYARHRSGQRAN